MAGVDGSTLAAILGGMGVGGVLLELVRQWFTRSGRSLDEAATIRQELRQDKRDLEGRIAVLAEKLDQAEADYYNMKLRCAVLEEQNRVLTRQIALIEERCLREHGDLRAAADREGQHVTRELDQMQRQMDEEHPS